MTKKIYLLGLIWTLLTLYSCEKSLDLHLDELPPKVIVEGGIIAGENARIQVKYTKAYSAEFYWGDEEVNVVKNARVFITEVGGNTEELFLQEDNYFTGNQLIGAPNKTYRLRITTDEEEISAECALKQAVPINAIELINNDGRNRLHVHWKDPIEEKNYYRIKISYNVKSQFSDDIDKEEVNKIFLFSDAQFNGQDIDYLTESFYSRYEDTEMNVELYSLDPIVYEFFKSLRKIKENGGETTFLKAPGNPPTNLSSGAGGVFNATNYSQKLIIVE